MRHDEIWKWLGIAFLSLGGALVGLLLWVCVYGYSPELRTLEDIAYDAYEEDGLELVIGGNIGGWLFAPAGAVAYPFNRDVGAAILGIRHVEVKIFELDGSPGSVQHSAFADGIRSAAREFGFQTLAEFQKRDESVRIYYTLDDEDEGTFYIAIRNDETIILASIRVDLARILEAAGRFNLRHRVKIDWSNARSPSIVHCIVTV